MRSVAKLKLGTCEFESWMLFIAKSLSYMCNKLLKVNSKSAFFAWTLCPSKLKLGISIRIRTHFQKKWSDQTVSNDWLCISSIVSGIEGSNQILVSKRDKFYSALHVCLQLIENLSSLTNEISGIIFLFFLSTLNNKTLLTHILVSLFCFRSG